MKKLFYILFLIAFSVSSVAQEKKWGRVSASVESSDHFYVDDAKNNFLPKSGFGGDPKFDYLDGSRYASNNYIKVDYYKDRLSAGIQLEGYFPTTIGYPISEYSLTLSNAYVSWIDKSYSVTAGSFYEQLGSGLLFRSWEDRALGLNNALLGARATYNYKDIVAVRVFGGIPRMGKVSHIVYNTQMQESSAFGLGLTKTGVAAADAAVSLSDCFDWDRVILSVEGSLLYKYENMSDYLVSEGFKTNNIGWSGRVNLDLDGFYFKGEYVDAGIQDRLSMYAERANAQLIELGYNSGGLGVSLSARRLYSMNQKIYTCSPDGFVVYDYYNPSVNVLSYCPALCTQYTYSLANLVPYTPLTDGEVGGQLDAFYNFRRGTKLGGKRGMKVHANVSTYFSQNDNGGFSGGKLRMWDASLDVERQWTKKFKSTLMYAAQNHEREQMGVVLTDAGMVEQELYVGTSHTFVADLLYKWTTKFSTRLELQYLATDGYQKDWMAAQLEVSLAPHWSVFASDMYNHGSSKMHYYNGGVSYAIQGLRIAAGYGRYRAGFICSGGVCREIPAYTGANLTLTASF